MARQRAMLTRCKVELFHSQFIHTTHENFKYIQVQEIVTFRYIVNTIIPKGKRVKGLYTDIHRGIFFFPPVLE